jgi:radical SAM protein with 4Fe4S-binding SPASM domain
MSDWADYKMTGFTGNDGRIACGHLIGTCPIAWDGSVEACVWDGDCRNVVGNVNDESLAEIWKRKNEGIVRIHMEHDWDNLPQMCVGCTTWKNIGENRQDEFGNNQNRNYDVKNNLYV